MSFYDYILKSAGSQNIYVTDSEIIDQPEDYKELISDLFKMTNGELELESFDYTESDEDADFEITVSGSVYSLKLDISGWIDENFVKKINKILIDKKSENRFYTFWSMDSFGQELGFLFYNQDEVKKMYDYAKSINDKVFDFSEQYQITDGVKEEGFDEI